MAIKMIAVQCPNCQASLNIESDRDSAFCTYCGAKILIYNENEHVYRKIDDAEVIRAKTERDVRLAKYNLANKVLDQYITRHNREYPKLTKEEKKEGLIMAAAIFTAVIIMMVLMYLLGDKI